jgi:hypothetical protein
MIIYSYGAGPVSRPVPSLVGALLVWFDTPQQVSEIRVCVTASQEGIADA